MGKNFQKLLKKLNLDESEINKIENNQSVSIKLDEEVIALEAIDLEIVSEDIDGWLVASEKGITVALDIQLDQKLINEGICRELINKIQNLRKDSGLQVTDKIYLKIQKDIILEKAIFENQNYILSETLAEKLEFSDSLDNGIEIKFDNINSKLHLTKIE